MQDLVFQFQEIVIGDKNRPRFIEKDLEKGLEMVQKTKKKVKINSPPFGMYM